MSAIAETGSTAPARRGPFIAYASIQRGALWLLGAAGGFVLVEPSPYEFVFLLVVFAFLLTGIKLSQKLLPLIILLLLYNLGGVFSLIPWMDEAPSVRFTAVSVYLMLNAIVLAAIMAEDAGGRIETLRRGWTFAAWYAAIAGILGYFDVSGLGDVFSYASRASGTFKDPNVLGPFLVLPVIFTLQRMLIGRSSMARGLLVMSVPLMGLFLTFSRGAWGHLVASVVLMAALTYLASPSVGQRARIVGLSILATMLAAAALLVALSFESIRSVFEIRASLEQSYDLGVTGRFGSQLRSLPLLLDAANGFGPLRFRFLFPEDPHNVYVNGFASYGWLGGFAWLALTAATLYVGWRLVFRRFSLRMEAIAIWSVLFVTILQGMQIDTDHWRHLYVMLGLIWGLAALPDGGALPRTPSVRST